MDIRYSTNPNDVKRYTTEELRKEFLIQNLYEPDQVKATYSHVDRMVVMGIMPVKETAPTSSWSAGRQACSILAELARSWWTA